MKFDINGKSYELKFDFRFVKQIDKEYTVREGGMAMGMGLALAHNFLEELGDLNALANVIYAATDGPTRENIETAIEEHAEKHDGLDDLFKDLGEAMGKAPLVKTSLKKAKAKAQEAQN